MITNNEIIDVCGRISELLAERDRPCRDWTVFIRWTDKSGQPWTMDYTAADCDTPEQAVSKVMGYINGMPEDWRVQNAWAARSTDITRMEGYRFSHTPQFQVR